MRGSPDPKGRREREKEAPTLKGRRERGVPKIIRKKQKISFDFKEKSLAHLLTEYEYFRQE